MADLNIIYEPRQIDTNKAETYSHTVQLNFLRNLGLELEIGEYFYCLLNYIVVSLAFWPRRVKGLVTKVKGLVK